jgi:hypothetical protein
VAEHHDLEFLEVPGAAAEYDELEQALQSDVGKRSEQARPPVFWGKDRATLRGHHFSVFSGPKPSRPSPAFVRAIEFAHPTGFRTLGFGQRSTSLSKGARSSHADTPSISA